MNLFDGEHSTNLLEISDKNITEVVVLIVVKAKVSHGCEKWHRVKNLGRNLYEPSIGVVLKI